MNWLQLHPDGVVYIRDGADAVLYEARLAEFALDYGASFPVPGLDGRPVAQLECFEGKVYAYDAKGNELEVRGRIAFEPYEEIIDALDRLREARTLRENPPLTPEQQAEAQRLSEFDAEIAADTTLGQLKAMSNAEFNDWWEANIDTSAKATAVLKRLARVIIRRLL